MSKVVHVHGYHSGTLHGSCSLERTGKSFQLEPGTAMKAKGNRLAETSASLSQQLLLFTSGKANGPSLSPPGGSIGESVSQVVETSVVPAPPPQPPSLELPPPPPPPPHQPLSTISIQDITSVQLKRTATKTMSCPHPSINGQL
ncbi:unnamed protein product [Nesidiocoris tenuis]|uniref:Uncharacterized protein n=1 Tax=Nesidiocoris tenuis TaxID=355587 RepID=A0A6H5GDU3_9HEMI|nr:unnamed protein product [Nesidiocoris tenuis]